MYFEEDKETLENNSENFGVENEKLPPYFGDSSFGNKILAKYIIHDEPYSYNNSLKFPSIKDIQNSFTLSKTEENDLDSEIYLNKIIGTQKK